MPTQKRRIRSPHPGVKLKKRTLPSGSIAWRAVYEDPDTGKETYTTLDLPNADTRRTWAISKAKSIAKRRMELEGGAARATGSKLPDVIKRYFEAHTQLRPRTVKIYRTAADKLIAWATGEGLELADDINRARLMEFRASLIREPKRGPVKAEKGGRRGTFAATQTTRSAVSVNQELRAVRTVLGYLGDLDMFARLSHDDLRRALKLLKAAREAPAFLQPHQCQALLEAAMRHDAAVWAETRAEHVGLRAVGTTPRFEPIAPFLACALLTGMRCGEALALRWADVDLNTKDADGKVVGELRLRASATKTSIGRVVSLDVSPSVRTLLGAMKLRAGEHVYVFGGDAPMIRAVAEAARKRLVGAATSKQVPRKRRAKARVAGFGAPAFTWQLLRATVATYQCNAPSLFGAAAAFVSAKRLGHSIAVSERNYAGVYAVPTSARTLEDAMTIGPQMAELVARVSSAPRKPRTDAREAAVST